MLFPNKILYTSRVLQITTTYCVELSESEFLDLKILFPLENLGIRRGDRLKRVAEKIVDASESELEMTGDIPEDLRKSLDIAKAFDYEQFGKIVIGGYTGGETGGYTISDGNHRGIALAVLRACEQVEYQPITAVLAVSKDITEDITYADEVSIPRGLP